MGGKRGGGAEMPVLSFGCAARGFCGGLTELQKQFLGPVGQKRKIFVLKGTKKGGAKPRRNGNIFF